jgi:hypothetical protein
MEKVNYQWCSITSRREPELYRCKGQTIKPISDALRTSWQCVYAGCHSENKRLSLLLAMYLSRSSWRCTTPGTFVPGSAQAVVLLLGWRFAFPEICDSVSFLLAACILLLAMRAMTGRRMFVWSREDYSRWFTSSTRRQILWLRRGAPWFTHQRGYRGLNHAF